MCLYTGRKCIRRVAGIMTLPVGTRPRGTRATTATCTLLTVRQMWRRRRARKPNVPGDRDRIDRCHSRLALSICPTRKTDRRTNGHQTHVVRFPRDRIDRCALTSARWRDCRTKRRPVSANVADRDETVQNEAPSPRPNCRPACRSQSIPHFRRPIYEISSDSS